MKGSVSNYRHEVYVSFIFFVAILFSVYFILNTFFKRITFEQIMNWKEAELISLSQGNILSSVAKLQRVIDKSSIITGVQVFDLDGKNLLKIGNQSDLNFLEIDSMPKVNLFQESFFFKSRVGLRLPTATIIIFAEANFLFIVLSLIVFYLLVVTLLYTRNYKRFALTAQKNKSDIEINILKYQNENKQKIFTLSQKLAHDIRSPISTLNLISSKITDPDIKSLQLAVVGQINAIANNLLNESKNTNSSTIALHTNSQIMSENKTAEQISNQPLTKFNTTHEPHLIKMLQNLEKEYAFKASAISQKISFEINYPQIEKNYVSQKLTSIIYSKFY